MVYTMFLRESVARLALFSLTLVPFACTSPTVTDASSEAGLDATADTAIDTPAEIAPDAAPDVAQPSPFTLAQGCDPLVPSHCGLPFPSDTWRVADAAARGGFRILFGPQTLPLARNGTRTPADGFRDSDGFSPGGYLLTHMPGATVTGLPSPDTMQLSLEADSPTVIIEADTGVRVAHFAELDMHSRGPSTRAFMIRPAARLKDSTRYIVAIRRVVDAAGVALPPSDAFRALRENSPYPFDPSIDARRAHYETMFTQLATAGVGRADLQLVWDFTTASRENNTAAMLAIRDTALAAAGADGPPYAIDSVTTDVNADIATRIVGHITVPLYLDQPGPGGRMHFGTDGVPVQNGTTSYPFTLVVPRSATHGTPCPLVYVGHGLFGDHNVIDGAIHQAMANRYCYVLFAMDWIGMSHNDPPAISAAINTGDITNFGTVPDRSRQGFLNALLAMRTMTGAFVRDPNVQFGGVSAIDPTRRHYFGGSLGGIYGTSYMALTTDVQRGLIAVPGQAFTLMLPRSVLYDQFELVLNGTVRDAIDAQVALGLAQMLWDRAEPVGYSPYVTSNPLPGTIAHRILMLSVLGDHQVPNVATHNLARTMGLRLLEPAVRPVFGLQSATGAFDGSVFIEEDWGLPPVPLTDLPMRDGTDPHGSVLDPAPAQMMLDQFFRTGIVQNACAGSCTPD